MGRLLACPQGVARCDDVSGFGGLGLLFPLAVVLAFALAWPLARFVPRRRRVGAALALIAGVAYRYFSVDAPVVSLMGVVLGTLGLALVLGRRPPHASYVVGERASPPADRGSPRAR